MKKRWKQFIQREQFSLRDCICTLMMLLGAVLLCLLIQAIDESSNFVSMVFILAVFLIARMTKGYLYGVCSALASVLIVNYLFTYPFFRFNFTLAGYPVAILSLLAVSIITSTLTTQAKHSVEARLEAEREKTRSNLLRAVSHDLRTPLTGILGATSAILENDGALESAERIRLLEDVQDDAQWLIRMVENLLTITRMDTGETKLVKTPEAGEEVLESAIGKFRKQHPDIRISVQVPEEFLMVPMDAVLIAQVLTNLMENSVQHGRTTKSLSIRLERRDTWGVFSVCDDGCGIDESILPRIFEGGVSTSRVSTTDQKRNMGIGLSVCHTIIRAHNGIMEADNLPQGGARFTFQLPLNT